MLKGFLPLIGKENPLSFAGDPDPGFPKNQPIQKWCKWNHPKRNEI